MDRWESSPRFLERLEGVAASANVCGKRASVLVTEFGLRKIIRQFVAGAPALDWRNQIRAGHALPDDLEGFMQ